MGQNQRDALQALLGDDYRVEAGRYYEVFGPDETMSGYYDEELDVVVGHARVFFEGCNGHSESFLLELGRRAIEEHADEFEQRGFSITEDDSVIFEDTMGRDCPYYTVGVRAQVESLEDAANQLRSLYEAPFQMELDVGLS